MTCFFVTDCVTNSSSFTSFDADAESVQSFGSSDDDADDYSDSSLSSATGDPIDLQFTDSDDLDEELAIDEGMFEPLYDNARVTVCGAYCALMEFKRACRLPFTTIAMLLQLLQLLCPPNNSLPQSIYKLRKFFEKFSSPHQKHRFCSDCKTKLKETQSQCDDPSCRHIEPSTLIDFDPTKAIRRVLKSKFCS